MVLKIGYVGFAIGLIVSIVCGSGVSALAIMRTRMLFEGGRGMKKQLMIFV
jgi:hypothetical protein